MASERAINTPFDADEVKEIALQEFRKRLDGLSPLQGAKEYAAFKLDFEVKITIRRAGETMQDARQTLAWGSVALPSAADLDAVAADTEAAEATSTYESKEPNQERVERDMPLMVESGPAGNKTRRKVKVK